MPPTQLDLEISGLGIVIYSPFAAAHIANEDDYLQRKYNNSSDVVEHLMNGTIVGFCTGSPGRFTLKISSGYPTQFVLDASEFKLRLGVIVRDQQLCFRDLYDLMQWFPCPTNQIIRIPDGIYHVTVCSNVPESGVIGDGQTIQIYLQPLKEFPILKYAGVPQLCD
jgi:hypothetical protein